MTDPATAQAFLESEVEALEPFGSVAIAPGGNPLHMVEMTRGEDGGLEVRVPGRPSLLPEIPAQARSRLRDRGFTSLDPANQREPWVKAATDAASAVHLARQVVTEVWEQKPDVSFDIAHGNHKAEHEAQLKLAAVRREVEKTLTDMSGGPVEKDRDGDYMIAVDDVHVLVAPRAVHGGIVMVRVFTITNVGIAVTPELGLFLARLNFGLMFGRFALDAEHSSVWFDESLLGEQLNDEVLRFTIKVVGATADQWDDRFKQMFGGVTYQDILKKRSSVAPPPTKPGEGGYL